MRKAAAFLVVLVPVLIAVYAGWVTTIGVTWSHNQALDRCFATPPGSYAIRHQSGSRGGSVTDRWTWWPPGHAHRCVYDDGHGRTVTRPARNTSVTVPGTRGFRATTAFRDDP